MQALRRPVADVGDPASQLTQVVGLVGSVGGFAHHCDLPAPVEHPVAGSAVAHSRAQPLRLARVLLRPHHAGGQHHGAGLLHLAADAQIVCAAHGQEIQHPAVPPLHPHLSGVGAEALQQFGTGHIVKTQIVVDAAGLEEGIVPVVPADHQYRLVARPGLDGGGQARWAAADHRDIVHWYSSSRSPKRAESTAATSGLAIS